MFLIKIVLILFAVGYLNALDEARLDGASTAFWKSLHVEPCQSLSYPTFVITVLGRKLSDSVLVGFPATARDRFLNTNSSTINVTCVSDIQAVVIGAPELDQPRQRRRDMQWLALAAEVSDVVVYIAHDNVFTSDVDFLSVLLVEHDTAAVTTTGMHTNVSPSLQYVVVALDTEREIDRRDEDALWRPILHIPRKRQIDRANLRLERNASAVTLTYVHQLLQRHRSTLRSWQQVQDDLRLSATEVFAESADAPRWWTPSWTERLAMAHSDEGDLSTLLHEIDNQFASVTDHLRNSTATTIDTESWSYPQQRIQDLARNLEVQLNSSLAQTHPLLYEQVLKRVRQQATQLQTAMITSKNDRHHLRYLLTETAIEVYTHYAVLRGEEGSDSPSELVQNCTSRNAASALACALHVVKSTTAAQRDPSLRSEVVDDLSFTDAIFQQYELHRDVKDLLVASTTHTHFLRTMSMLLDIGYTKEEALQLVLAEFDSLQADLENTSVESGVWVAALKQDFTQAAVHFTTRPRPVFYYPAITAGGGSKFKKIARSVAAAVVGATIAVFMPGALPAVLPSLSGLGAAMLTGATAATASAAINKEKRLLDASLRGALLAGAANVIGDVLPFATAATSTSGEAMKGGAFSLTNAVERVAAEGLAGCAVSELTGGKCKHGLVQGAIGEVSASAQVVLGVESRLLSSALAGSASATSAWAVGGSWEEGFLHGAFIDQFNHAMHDLKRTVTQHSMESHLTMSEDVLVLEVSKRAVEGKDRKIIVLAKDADSSQLRKLRLVGEYVEAAGLGAVDLAVDVMKGTATLILHPIDTAVAVKQVLASPDLLDKLQHAATQYARSLADVQGALSSPAAFRAWTKDALDLATFVVPATKLSKASAAASKSVVRGSVAAMTPIVFETVPKGTVDIAVIGATAERNARSMLRASGYKVHHSQLTNGNGIDVIASRLNPLTGLTEFTFVEVKATGKTLSEASAASLAHTRHGQQMSTEWLSKKLTDLNRQDPQLVRDVLHTMEASKGAAPPSRLLYRPTSDQPMHFENHRLPHFDSADFHRHLKDLTQ